VIEPNASGGLPGGEVADEVIRADVRSERHVALHGVRLPVAAAGDQLRSDVAGPDAGVDLECRVAEEHRALCLYDRRDRLLGHCHVHARRHVPIRRSDGERPDPVGGDRRRVVGAVIPVVVPGDRRRHPVAVVLGVAAWPVIEPEPHGGRLLAPRVVGHRAADVGRSAHDERRWVGNDRQRRRRWSVVVPERVRRRS